MNVISGNVFQIDVVDPYCTRYNRPFEEELLTIYSQVRETSARFTKKFRHFRVFSVFLIELLTLITSRASLCHQYRRL